MKGARKFFLLAAIAGSLALAGPALGADGPIIQPALQVPIPGLKLTGALMNAGHLSAPFLAQYISGVYKFLLSVVGVVAAVSMIWGGFLWTTSGGAADRAKAGKKRIGDAVIGMVLAYGSYLILYLVNPALVNFRSFEIISVQPEIYSAEDQYDEGDIAEAPPAGPETDLPKGPICRTVETCRAYCNKAQGDWPKAVQGALNPADAILIPESAGLTNTSRQSGSPALVAALTRAGSIAVSTNKDYRIAVTSGYRPLSKQISLVCDKIREADAVPSEDAKRSILSTIGVAVAWPGGSNHGYGNAVDLKLTQGGTDLTVSGKYREQSDTKYRAPSLILDQIMTRAGFKRYGKEIWHFEVNTSTSCRCQYPSCPWPPGC